MGHMLAEIGQLSRCCRLVLGPYAVIVQQQFPDGCHRDGVCTALPLKRQHPGDLAGKRGSVVSSFINRPAVRFTPGLAWEFHLHKLSSLLQYAGWTRGRRSLVHSFIATLILITPSSVVAVNFGRLKLAWNPQKGGGGRAVSILCYWL